MFCISIINALLYLYCNFSLCLEEIRDESKWFSAESDITAVNAAEL